jgi:hypothetical protein
MSSADNAAAAMQDGAVISDDVNVKDIDELGIDEIVVDEVNHHARRDPLQMAEFNIWAGLQRLPDDIEMFVNCVMRKVMVLRLASSALDENFPNDKILPADKLAQLDEEGPDNIMPAPEQLLCQSWAARLHTDLMQLAAIMRHDAMPKFMPDEFRPRLRGLPNKEDLEQFISAIEEEMARREAAEAAAQTAPSNNAADENSQLQNDGN